MNEKRDYDNKKVKLVASEPSSSVKKYAQQHMHSITRSSRKVLKALTDENSTKS